MATNNNGGSTFYKEVLPFVVMVTIDFMNVGLSTLYKAAANKGMSNHVFVVYSHGVAAIFLLPSPFFSIRSRALPPLSGSTLGKIFLLAVNGCISQTMGYTGISYSSPVLASAMSNLVPAFTFILAVIFRMEKIEVKRSSSRAKVLGTVVSIAGAFIVTVYRGQKILVATTSTPNFLTRPLSSAQSNWMIGGLFLTIESIFIPMWYILLTRIMNEYPAEATVVFFYNLFVSCLAGIVRWYTEHDSSKWRIKPDIALASFLCSGIIGACLSNAMRSWALRVKGPVYVAMFKPLSIAIAVVMGVVILGDNLYLGSILGATVVIIGFYTVIWGKAKEMPEYDDESSDLESSSAQKFPLLHNYKNEVISNK